MNDRTMIAAMAMQGMIACPQMYGSKQELAEDAVEYADALLKELGDGTWAARDRIRNDALEEAAKLVEDAVGGRTLPSDIRALKKSEVK